MPRQTAGPTRALPCCPTHNPASETLFPTALADRVVAVLKAQDREAQMESLRVQVAAGDEGQDGMNSAVLAIATAILKRGLK